MTETYHLCTRNSRHLLHQQVGNSDFKDQAHNVPYMQFNAAGDRVFSNLMSGDWAWNQADKIASESPDLAQGAMFIPVVAGSDKTTVSIATGHQQYHPLYHASLSLIFEPLRAGMSTPELVRCPDGHLRHAFYGLGPYIADYPEQVYLAGIVQNWCPKCEAHRDFLDAPGALRRSPQRTDFLIACFDLTSFDPGILWNDFGIRCDYLARPFTYNFPRADIHELLSSDLLHQVVKGTFKDHIVTWIYNYLTIEHGEARAHEITQDIDRRISSVPIFPGLRRFPDGRNFEQWTGNDSKALMKVLPKVFLAAIVGYVPSDMVRCVAALLDFCYIARQNSLTSKDLDKLDDALVRFHQFRNVFIEAGVRLDISLPRQHSLKHYHRSIRLFGSPNGLCSSITESKHIDAVKKPWRCSSRHEPLFQMLQRISREEKLHAARRYFARQGMMDGSTSSYTAMIHAGGAPVPEPENKEEEGLDDDEDLGPSSGPKVLSSIKLAKRAEPKYPDSLVQLADHIQQPHFPTALRQFIWQQLHPDSDTLAHTVPIADCPDFHGKLKVYHSAIARFYAPSDICGVGGMCHERIRSVPCWRGKQPRRDTVFVETDPDVPGMRGMAIGRVLLFFSFSFRETFYPCALVNWLVLRSNEPDPETGLWVVHPEFAGNHRTTAVIHLDSIARGAHLLPIYGSSPLPEDFDFTYSLDAFRAFFVNTYVDHHAHEFIA
ncbi:hypothetical protein M413DRAFT_76253 [Hebeloma cylindrosporum]|uniref:Uncharacterized protein n=1 Tax=Hebeloma cylindrosporum TaxID=76867 RepID=A0A0C2XKC2_HEBCY|nr:hypothetical protein M413DRAFT_76253 [Hebeloma cylindrosporum h7]